MDEPPGNTDEREDGSTVTPDGTWSDAPSSEARGGAPCGWRPADLSTSPELPARVDMAMSLLDYQMRQAVAEMLEEAWRG
jgi:hypothetical protein